MQKIYVIGGYRKTKPKIFSSVNSCMCYDIKSNNWTFIATMNKRRQKSSCAVFEGRIVVTGGLIIENSNSVGFYTKTVESYCFHENKWTYFPNLLVKRSQHTTLSINNKLFVIGGYYKSGCEVFESTTNNFVFVESLPKITSSYALSIGYKIYLFQCSLQVYDDEKTDVLILSYNDKQSALVQENSLQLDCEVFSCAKLPKK